MGQEVWSDPDFFRGKYDEPFPEVFMWWLLQFWSLKILSRIENFLNSESLDNDSTRFPQILPPRYRNLQIERPTRGRIKNTNKE